MQYLLGNRIGAGASKPDITLTIDTPFTPVFFMYSAADVKFKNPTTPIYYGIKSMTSTYVDVMNGYDSHFYFTWETNRLIVNISAQANNTVDKKDIIYYYIVMG